MICDSLMADAVKEKPVIDDSDDEIRNFKMVPKKKTNKIFRFSSPEINTSTNK